MMAWPSGRPNGELGGTATPVTVGWCYTVRCVSCCSATDFPSLDGAPSTPPRNGKAVENP